MTERPVTVDVTIEWRGGQTSFTWPQSKVREELLGYRHTHQREFWGYFRTIPGPEEERGAVVGVFIATREGELFIRSSV